MALGKSQQLLRPAEPCHCRKGVVTKTRPDPQTSSSVIGLLRVLLKILYFVGVSQRQCNLAFGGGQESLGGDAREP